MTTTLVRLIREEAQPLKGAAGDYDSLLDLVGDAPFVLLGEASHGTHEFYKERARITRRLISEEGFNAVAVEADWPDACRVNRYVSGGDEDADAEEALEGFLRFPTWMWRNAEMLDFTGWLRARNDAVEAGAEKTGFYGLDLYSLHSSIEAVIAYLGRVDPDAARRARRRYACFDHFGKGTESYGLMTGLGMADTCEDEVIDELTELRMREAKYLCRDGRVAADEFFFAEQNARLVRNAEEYYRTMFRGRESSWNLRDRHMFETLESLVSHLDEQHIRAKVVVWAHNSHLGDARATSMHTRGELNLGQLVRERHGAEAVLVGFTTHDGTVIAASEWDSAPRRMTVSPALTGSFEALFHEVPFSRFMLPLGKGGSEKLAFNLRAPRLERAIGVVYRPETERHSHYFQARLADQFDVVLHFDRTSAVEPLERVGGWEPGEVEETFPSGL
jgi:erythromycin esterase-like protein